MRLIPRGRGGFPPSPSPPAATYALEASPPPGLPLPPKVEGLPSPATGKSQPGRPPNPRPRGRGEERGRQGSTWPRWLSSAALGFLLRYGNAQVSVHTRIFMCGGREARSGAAVCAKRPAHAAPDWPLWARRQRSTRTTLRFSLSRSRSSWIRPVLCRTPSS